MSPATVSRAFGRPELLRPATVAHVRAVAAELGYLPNAVARGLSTGRYATIALVVPDIANPFFPPLVRGAQRAADLAGYGVFLGDSDEDPAREDALLARFTGQVEGVVLVSSRLRAARVREHAERRPVVRSTGTWRGYPGCSWIRAWGMSEAVEHLAALGHRRFAYVNGPRTSWAHQQRRRTLRRATDARGLDLVTVDARRPTYETGIACVPDLLAVGATAVVAFDDVLAQGILAGLADAGVDVPRDLSVVGCDDVVAATTTPPLTTVSASAGQAGHAAVNLLFGLLGNDDLRDARYVVHTRLVVRSSTGPATTR